MSLYHDSRMREQGRGVGGPTALPRQLRAIAVVLVVGALRWRCSGSSRRRAGCGLRCRARRVRGGRGRGSGVGAVRASGAGASAEAPRGQAGEVSGPAFVERAARELELASGSAVRFEQLRGRLREIAERRLAGRGLRFESDGARALLGDEAWLCSSGRSSATSSRPGRARPSWIGCSRRWSESDAATRDRGAGGADPRRGRAGGRRQARGARAGAARDPRGRARAARGLSRSREDAVGAVVRAGGGCRVHAGAVHARPAAVGHHRVGDLQPARQRVRVPPGADLHQPAARGRGEPCAAEDAGGAAGGDAGAAGDERTDDHGSWRRRSW